METVRYVRKPIYVMAVQVTEENLKEIANWCGGRIHKVSDGTVFIKVLGYRSKTLPRTKAFIGDWVLSGDKGFRVYTNSAFVTSFHPVANAPLGGAWPVNHAEALKTVTGNG